MKIFLFFLVILINFLTTALAMNKITSVDITKSTFRGLSHCLHYRVTGLCFWLHCSSLGCYIKPNLKVDHYLPDAVVSVYAHRDDNPWWFARHVLDPVAYKVGHAQIQSMTHFSMRDGDNHQRSTRDVDNRFHEVDVIGHPVLLFLKQIPFLLTSTAKAYRPYYSSLSDAYAWRFPVLERFYPGSLIPGLHEVGRLLLHDWGPVFPRNGYVNQPDDAKAAAVVAQRAMDIVSKESQPHLYYPLLRNCGSHCEASMVKENSTNTRYQLIYPKVESQCVVFGESDIGHLHPWESDAASLGKHRYVWVLWRHYHGCLLTKNARYIGKIDF